MVETKPIDAITCTERHVRIDARLGELDTKIDTLEKSDATNTNEIQNLCKQIKSLVKVQYWFIGAIFTFLLGIVTYVITK